MKTFIFHLAFPVHDIVMAKEFYSKLGCQMGRETAHALIMDLGGHQIVAHKTNQEMAPQKGIYPRHFGLIFKNKKDWDAILNHASESNLEFYKEAYVRHPGLKTEHHSFFLVDPSHNLLEFKYYVHESAIFENQEIDRIGDL